MSLAFIKEKQKYMIPVDYSELKRGTWSNVTRNQEVTIVNIYENSVEYRWDGCPIGRYTYIKSKEHFLRSYIKIK